MQPNRLICWGFILTYSPCLYITTNFRVTCLSSVILYMIPQNTKTSKHQTIKIPKHQNTKTQVPSQNLPSRLMYSSAFEPLLRLYRIYWLKNRALLLPGSYPYGYTMVPAFPLPPLADLTFDAGGHTQMIYQFVTSVVLLPSGFIKMHLGSLIHTKKILIVHVALNFVPLT